jgi:hypothetical protein
MKKWIVLMIFLTLAIFSLASGSTASAAKSNDEKPTQKVTPGVKATEKAAEKSSELDDDAGKGKSVNVKGEITALGKDSITILKADGTSVTVALGAANKLKIPGPKKNAGAQGLQVGMTVMAHCTSVDGKLTARMTMVIPGKPERVHRVGTVAAYEPGKSITIKDKDGNQTTFTLTADTKILPAERAENLKTGAAVTIISRRDPAGGALTAQGIVIHP